MTKDPIKQIPFNVLRDRPVFSAADVVRGGLETKDDDVKPKAKAKPSEDLDTKDALRQFMESFEEYKSTNDERLTALSEGKSDPLGDEKLAKIDDFLDKYEALNQKKTLEERNKEAVEELEKKFDHIETVLDRLNSGGDPSGDDEKKMLQVSDWARTVVEAIQYGHNNLDESKSAVLNKVVDEYKTLSVSTNTEGGYLAPVDMVREILKTVTEISAVRSLARVRQTGSKAVEIPKRTGQFAAQWVAEQGTRNETPGLTYGVEEIPVHEIYALIDITQQMLEDGMFNMAEEIQIESGEQFALAEGAAFVKGDGIGKPEGFLTNSNVQETNSGSATTIADAQGQANGLITMKYTLKSFYTQNSVWLMNRTTMGSVRKLKDGQNNYIWMPGIAQGRPNTIDGDPYVEMPDMPNEGAGTTPIAYGDFRRGYTWVDRIQMEMLRDPYTQATAGKIRYIMRRRVGGRVTMSEAIKKLKCSA